MDGPKVMWDAAAAKFFYECAAKQVNLGPTKFLTTAGYKNLVANFNAKSGRNYERKQLKNCWDDLKAIYSAWVFYKSKSTGLGWDEEKQTITADDNQWVELIKIHKPVKAFHKGPLDNLDELTIMFERANVDGKSSVMPGVEEEADIQIEEEVIELYDEDNDSPAPSPLPRPKHPASAISCSPSKFKKNNVPKDFKRFVHHVINEDRLGQTSKTTENDEIVAIMEEVAKCGASEISDEFYMATKLFAKSSNHDFFYAMKTSEGRLNWLKRQFEERKRN